jgi:hypothetical protein
MPRKAGLHKGVSSIFTGVPIPQKDDASDASHASDVSDARDKQKSSTATKEAPSYGPPSHLSGTTMKEILQSKKSPQKDIPAEKPKSEDKKDTQVQTPPVIKPARSEWLEQAIGQIKEKLFAPKPGVSPARQKAMVVLVPVMFIGMILAFYKVLGGGPATTTGPKEFKPSTAIGAVDASTIDWQIPELYPTTLRDPMQFKKAVVTPTTPTTPTPDETEDIVIKGILYDEENPSVIIGIEILHEGDKVSGATIIKINKDNVEFEMDGKKWTQEAK